MAENLARITNMARILAIVHIIVGCLLFGFGIADFVVQYFWTGYGCYGIWIGVWMCITGGLGIPGTRKERNTLRNAFAGVFMGFSITSAVFGGIIISSYSRAIAFYRDDYRFVYEQGYNDYNPTDSYEHNYGFRRVRKDNFDTEMALSAIILILGVVEFVIGIWAAVCLCMMKSCTCCYGNQQQGQVMFAPNSGYAMTQYPGGVPVSVPMQAGSGMVAIQTVTPGPQGGQPQMVMVPVSGTVGNQPQFAQIATSGGMTTDFQAQVPPKYEEGRYTKMGNDEFPVNT